MGNFDRAFDHIIATEGLYISHPLDKGGPTIYGLTKRTIEEYYEREFRVDEIKIFPVEDARDIYQKEYWNKIKGDFLPSDLAIAVFDQAVNRGIMPATISLQKALGVQADGFIGPKTLAAATNAFEQDVIFAFLRDSMRAYVGIVQRNASQIVFLQGWSNRVFRLLEMFCLG